MLSDFFAYRPKDQFCSTVNVNHDFFAQYEF